MRRLAVAVALCVSLPAVAECKKEEFNRYLAAAVRLYEGLEYERALDQLGKAKESSCGTNDDALLGMYEGVIRSDLGQSDQAKAAFKEALLLKPDAEVPTKVSPKVKKQIEALRGEAKKELAPILAKQEDERRKREAEEAKKAEEARRAEELRKAEDERKKVEAEKNDDARRRALDDARRADDAARNKPSVIVIEKPASDRPEQEHELIASPSNNDSDVASAVKTEVKHGRGVPVIPIVFGIIGLAAGGVGAYFGVTGHQIQTTARNFTSDQAMRQMYIDNGNQYALIADVLFGVAGAAAIGAIIALFAAPVEQTTEAAK
jgi:tetratricopeptide (TPR) repeat protein